MNPQPNKPETDPKKNEGVIDPIKPRTTPGSNPNDPSRRNVSPGEPQRNDKEKQSDPKQKSPPDLQLRSSRHARGDFQFQPNRYTSKIE